jgi:hypothetical protein
VDRYTLPDLVLFGYRYNDFTTRARLLLDQQGIDYEFQVAPAGIHPDGSGLFGITKVPAIKSINDSDLRIADGLDEIEQWLKNHKS